MTQVAIGLWIECTGVVGMVRKVGDSSAWFLGEAINPPVTGTTSVAFVRSRPPLPSRAHAQVRRPIELETVSKDVLW
jgi:hypothetical protein